MRSRLRQQGGDGRGAKGVELGVNVCRTASQMATAVRYPILGRRASAGARSVRKKPEIIYLRGARMQPRRASSNECSRGQEEPKDSAADCESRRPLRPDESATVRWTAVAAGDDEQVCVEVTSLRDKPAAAHRRPCAARAAAAEGTESPPPCHNSRHRDESEALHERHHY